MTSLFQDAAVAASAAVDTVFGEPWIYQPMAAGGDVNARRAPDPDRAALPITGAYIDPYARALSGPTRSQGVKAEQPGHASGRPALSLDLAQLPYEPRRGDRVTRLNTGEVFEVAEDRPDRTGPRTMLDLNLIT